MKPLRPFLPLLALLALAPVYARSAGDPASRLILLVNSNLPESRRVAEHYAAARHVPAANIIALPMSAEETISWPEFLATIWTPLQAELVRQRWIDAVPMALTDQVGRREYVTAGHRISYLVTCRGVPLRIAHAPELVGPRPPPLDAPELRTNQGAVDSELSLLAQPDYPVNAFVPNPLFRVDHPSFWDLAKVVKVSRLDGPTLDDALTLVDRAMTAERTGLLGRAYVDLNGKHPAGDRWLESVVKDLTELGFDVDTDRTPGTFPVTARFDAPVLYFGWYAGNITGPFLLPGFRFPPGAIAVHIHSFSAYTLRAPEAGWVGPFVARGVTATVGNVYEPYLNFLHRPDLLLHALARGDTFGDAAYYAEPVLSWQAIAVGDPLYRPFDQSFAAQWRDRGPLPPALEGYAALWEMRRLERISGVSVYTESGPKAPLSLVIPFYQAQRFERAGNLPAAARELAGYVPPEVFPSDQWGLAHEVAQLLERAKACPAAEKIYASLMRSPDLPPELRIPWLRDAQRVAQAAGDPAQAVAWAQELGRLVPDEKK